MSGPVVALRHVSTGRSQADLLFYEDALAVVPRPGAGADFDGLSFLAVGVAALLTGRRLRDRAAAREAERRLPRRTRWVRLDDVRSVVVEPKPHGAATLTIDGRTYEVPQATTYLPPWRELLGPLFEDRLTVV